MCVRRIMLRDPSTSLRSAQDDNPRRIVRDPSSRQTVRDAKSALHSGFRSRNNSRDAKSALRAPGLKRRGLTPAKRLHFPHAAATELLQDAVVRDGPTNHGGVSCRAERAALTLQTS
jgi:hypothetical protein